MAKVRVPKDHRPPSRFGHFKCRWDGAIVKVSGVYRLPKEGEYFWESSGYASMAHFDFEHAVRVIMERVK